MKADAKRPLGGSCIEITQPVSLQLDENASEASRLTVFVKGTWQPDEQDGCHCKAAVREDDDDSDILCSQVVDTTTLPVIEKSKSEN